MDIEKVKKLLDDVRLEDAFKPSKCDENGYANQMPVIHSNYGYGLTPDGVKIITKKSAIIATNLYSRYLDEEALVWDSAKEELFVYIPDVECPNIAFKGSNWQYAKKLKSEYSDLSIYEVYKEIISKIKY